MLEFLHQIPLALFNVFQFIYHISWTYLICALLIIINLNLFLNASNTIKKLTWFTMLLFSCTIIIWLASLEIIGFILILTELTLTFLFFIVMTQINTQINNQITSKFYIYYNLFMFLVSLLVLLDFDLLNSINSISYYNASFLIVTADYFFIYYFLVIYLDVVIYIALILGLFSIYFIFLYYHLQKIQNSAYKQTKTIYFVRKQNLLHQAIYQNYLRWFQ